LATIPIHSRGLQRIASPPAGAKLYFAYVCHPFMSHSSIFTFVFGKICARNPWK